MLQAITNYILVEVSLEIEGMPGWNITTFPIKTTRYTQVLQLVTVEKRVEKDMKTRFKGIKTTHITAKHTSKAVAESLCIGGPGKMYEINFKIPSSFV